MTFSVTDPARRLPAVSHAHVVALLVSQGSWSNRLLLEGVASYARQHTRWRLALQKTAEGAAVDEWLLRAKPAGAIAEITSRGMVKTLRRAGMRIVDVLEEHRVPHVPQIVCDDQKIVRLAIDHLLDRGLKHLAFVGDADRQFAKRRRVAFNHYAKVRQRELHGEDDGTSFANATVMFPGTVLRSNELAGLAAWLRSLPKPVGVVACNDVWGSQVLRACTDQGIRVPDDVAVIGVDDDPVFCQISDPPLTSVDGNGYEIGYAAAALLDGMLSRGESPAPITFVAPGAIKTRGSTEVLSIADRDAAAAVRFVRDHACSGLTAAGAASRLGVSVRTLERLFARHLGHSPAAEISRVRLERARELLAASDLSVGDVARRAGYAYVESLHRAFRERFGLSPGAYRRMHTTRAERTPRMARPRGRS